ncbi:hypothetical protein [Levilactobacillus brevis]|uniref:hypothetical protein n=1 Tax=Levilactobacillus brevis TaxID=1580 RepID=UPI00159BB6DD
METEKGSPAENRASRASRFKGGGRNLINDFSSSCDLYQSYTGRLFLFVVLVDIAEERD